MITTTQRPPTVAVMPTAQADYFWTPDSAVLDVTRGFEIVARVACANWTAGGTICAKWGAAGQRSFGFAIATQLGIWFSVNGTAIANDLATLPAFAAGSTHWLRWSRDTGFSLFYYAADQINEPLAPPVNAGYDPAAFGLGTFSGSAGWVLAQLNVDSGERNPVFASTAQLEVGSSSQGAATFGGVGFNGTIYRVIVRFDGATVCDFNPQDATVPASSWVSRQTGETWTKNGAVSLSPPDQVSTSVLAGRQGRTTVAGAPAFATGVDVAKKADTTTTPSTPFATTSVCQKSGRTTTTLGLP